MKLAFRFGCQLVLRVIVVMTLLVVVSLPDGTDAGPHQERTTQDERDEVRQRRGEVAIEVDALEGEREDVQAALVTLAENVAAREAELDEAERAAEAADDDLTYARKAVAGAEKRIEALDAATSEFMVDAYVNPPTGTMLAALSSRNMSEAAVKRALIDVQSHSGADLLDQLAQAQEDLELEREAAETIAAEAEEKRAAVQTALTDVTAAHAQQESFALDVEDALESKLSEAAVLETQDRELSEQLVQEHAELARQLEAARQAAEAQRQREAEAAAAAAAPPAGGGGGNTGSGGGGSNAGGNSSNGGGSGGGAPAPAGPGTITPAPGGLATASCPRGGSITVAGSLGPSLRQLLDAAGAAGVDLCGWGWRDPQRQIELRRSHCGGSEYAIWHMPSSRCSPPTARPGRSMHERGLAVDFTCDGSSISSRNHRCFRWLSGNAASYGLYNLPSEPWHWSTTGK